MSPRFASPWSRSSVLRRCRPLVFGLLLASAAALPSWSAPAPRGAADRGGAPDARWRQAPLWDDGKAEFAAYEITWRRYGNLYPGQALLVLVKEPWAPELDVKADRPRPHGFDVLKLNHVRDVRTGIYTYHQMASVYFRRDSAALVKLATSSTEACGVSTALLRDGTLTTHSYFDGEGDRSQVFPAAAVPEDALPALLRDYVQGEAPAQLDIFPLLLMGRFRRLEPEICRVSKRPAVPLQVPAGTFTAVEIVLQGGGGSRSYVFEQAPPHRLLLYRDAEGTEYRLVKAERLAYWRLHSPGDESWWPAALRSPAAASPPSPEARP